MNEFINNLPEYIHNIPDPIDEFDRELWYVDKVLSDINYSSDGLDAFNFDVFELSAASALTNALDIEMADSDIVHNVFNGICDYLGARALSGHIKVQSISGEIIRDEELERILQTRSGCIEIILDSLIALTDLYVEEGRKYELGKWKKHAYQFLASSIIKERQ